MLAPWRKEKFPADITLEVLWRDDELKPAKALPIYEELKAKGMLVARISGSPIALALKDRMWEDHMGATSMATGPYYLSPPQSCFTYYPIYTDCTGAIADWFKANWKETRKPKVAYLTADNAMGRSIEIPEMKAYLEKIGYEFVGTQYVPLVRYLAADHPAYMAQGKGCRPCPWCYDQPRLPADGKGDGQAGYGTLSALQDDLWRRFARSRGRIR